MLAITRFLPITAAFTAVLALACDAAPDFDEAPVELRDGGTGTGGPVLNTWKLFTSTASTFDTHDQSIGIVRLLDVELLTPAGYVSIDDDSLWADHGKLRATLFNVPKSSTQFLNSRWTVRVGLNVLTAYISDVETAQEAELWDPDPSVTLLKLDPLRDLYTFVWYDDNHVAQTTCESDDVGGARTVVYGDIMVNHANGNITQRPNTLYMGCISGAVGKAALWGYAPDSPSEPSVSLDEFEEMTRVVRADYCADGTSFTDVGNAVSLRDRWGINGFADPSFTTEAVWKVGSGATCVSRIRSTGDTLLDPITCADGVTEIPLCPATASIMSEWALGEGDVWTKIEP